MSPLQITSAGFEGKPDVVESTRAEFSRCSSAVLPDFVTHEVLAPLTRRLDSEPCSPLVHVKPDGSEFARDVTLPGTSPVAHGFHLLMNDPAWLDAVRRVTGCAAITCFLGRVYKIFPRAGHHLDWHDDCRLGVAAGMSVNLTAEPYQGGIFRIRRKQTDRILAEISHARLGSAHLFRIDRETEHSVTDVSGDVPRSAFAGFFLTSPDRRSLFRTFYAAPGEKAK